MTTFPSFYSDTYGAQNQTPYAYQMMPDVPQPTMSPTASLPPLYPSMMTPQLNPPSPFPNYNLSQQRYAEGGHIMPEGLAHLAELLRGLGQREDKVLAHINPHEAQELQNKYGGDINPISGLPQFGKKHGVKKLAHKAKKGLKGATKYVLPAAAGTAGALLAPTIGIPAIAGGALGGGLGGLLGDKKHPLQAAILGGLGGALAGPSLGGGLKGLFSGQGFGAGFQGGLESIGSELGGLGSAIGLGGAPAFGAQTGPGGPINLVAPKALTGTSGGSASSFLDKALLGAAVLGTLGRREKQHYPKENMNVPEFMKNLSFQPTWQPKDQPRNISPLRRIVRQVSDTYRPGIDPEQRYFEEEEGPSFFKEGGYVEGGSTGQADDVHTHLPEGAFIIDANTVAQAGDGNSNAGGIRFDQFFKPHNRPQGLSGVKRYIKAQISDGEYEVPPHVVSSIGGGDNRRGAEILKKMVMNIRKHKGFKGFPPKAKSLEAYIHSRNVGR